MLSHIVLKLCAELVDTVPHRHSQRVCKMKRQKLAGGGYLQRMNAYDVSRGSADGSSTPQTHQQHSELYALLTREVLWGRMPAVKAIEIAKAAVADEVRHPHVMRLGALAGDPYGNEWRNWQSYMKPAKMLSAIRPVRVPINNTVTNGIKWDAVKLLYPHRLFATLHDDYPHRFSLHMVGGDPHAKLQQFWSEMENHPAYSTHPMHGHRLNSHKMFDIPLNVYGDGTPVTGIGKTWCRLVDSIIMSSCAAAEGQTWLNNNILAMVHAILMHTDSHNKNLTIRPRHCKNEGAPRYGTT